MLILNSASAFHKKFCRARSVNDWMRFYNRYLKLKAKFNLENDIENKSVIHLNSRIWVTTIPQVKEANEDNRLSEMWFLKHDNQFLQAKMNLKIILASSKFIMMLCM
jgi:hypothetical protein